jgi:translocation and assembly module TamA
LPRYFPALALACGLTSAAAIAQPVNYRTELPRVEDGQLQKALKASSNLFLLQQTEQPPSAAGLVRRAAQDRDRMLAALRSFGFYAGDVRVTIAGLPLGTEDLIQRVEEMAVGEPVEVAIAADPGPLFTLGRFEVLDAVTGQPQLRAEIDFSTLGINPGDPARADAVIRAQNEVLDQMRRQGYPFAAVPNRRVIVDHAMRQMEVTLFAEPGPFTLFGEIAVEGLENMDVDFVRDRIDAGPESPYSPEAVRGMRDSLAELDVFTGIRVDTADELDSDGRLPVTVHVTERPRRVVGFGADFNTSEGFGVRVYWGHRNLFGRAESLRLEAEVGRIGKNELGDIDYSIDVLYQAPDFLTRNQTLNAEISAGREAPDAYRREAIEALVGIDRRLSETLQVSAGIKAEISEVDDLGTPDPLYFVSVPLGFRLDSTDDPLDPLRGHRVALELTPYFVDRTLLRSSLAASTYFDARNDGDLVFAVRARVGSIVGEELLDVPSDKRFFSGGGGSIRGYAFQAIGPRTLEDNPLGGRSLLELGLEARVRITDEIGLVPFVEGGQVFEDSLPSLNESLQFGAGLGLRYFTGIGPLRFDLAFPINKRKGDDDFQIYVSIGQAF